MLYIGADHAGFKMKEKLKKFFDRINIEYVDFGTNSEESVDYPDYAVKVSQRVAEEKNAKGVLICGTGTGMAIAANKVKGIRAALAYDNYSAKMARNDNDINVLCLRGRKFSYEDAERAVKVWLNTPFSGAERHKRRIEKIRKLE